MSAKTAGRKAPVETTARTAASAAHHDPQPSAPSRRASLLILAAILLVSLLPRLATLKTVATPAGPIYYHLEWDERVLTTLVEQGKTDFFAYTLQGTPLLRELTPENYDYPIFFHPPGFVAVGRLLRFLPLPLVPVLMNLVTIALVFFVGRRLYDDERALWAAFLVAVCPVTWFVSQKIWLDNMVICMAAATVAATIWAADRRQPAAYALAGATFGIAFLAKAIAPVILPAAIVVVLLRDDRREMGKKVVAFLVPAALLIGWWQWTLYAHNGRLSPSAFPTADMMARFPFVAEIVARPPWFYLQNIVAITPVYLLALGALWWRERRDLIPCLWFLGFFIATTGFGLLGGGYQTRYLAPAYPALALVTANQVPRLGIAGIMSLVALVGYGLMHALLYAVLDAPHAADFQISIPTMVARSLSEVGRLQ